MNRFVIMQHDQTHSAVFDNADNKPVMVSDEPDILLQVRNLLDIVNAPYDEHQKFKQAYIKEKAVVFFVTHRAQDTPENRKLFEQAASVGWDSILEFVTKFGE